VRAEEGENFASTEPRIDGVSGNDVVGQAAGRWDREGFRALSLGARGEFAITGAGMIERALMLSMLSMLLHTGRRRRVRALHVAHQHDAVLTRLGRVVEGHP
jgi:hypothetical protein